MSKKIRIGFLPLTKVNWTNEAMQKQRRDAIEMLSKIPNVEIVGGEDMIETEEQSLKILERFEKDRPDMLVALFTTFALGTIVSLFAKRLKVPVVLWSIKEPDPAGGRLQANSFCAANMNSHFLYRFHIPYFHVHGNIGDEKTLQDFDKTVRVVRAMDAVSKMRIGLIGGRVPGFYTSSCDEMMLRSKLGPELKYIMMLEVMNDAKTISKEDLDEALKIVKADATGAEASEGDLKKSAALYAAVCGMRKKFGVDTFAFRCWPEVINSDLYGITACSTIGHLTNHGVITACEGDVYGAVLMRLQYELTGELPFFCDLIMCEPDKEYGVVWHCGAAPCKLCKKGFKNSLRNSSTVVTKGVVNEFPLKPGRVTLARLGEKRDGDGFRMLIAPGEGIDTDLFVRGNPLKVKFDAGCERVRDTVITQGFEHHFSMAYGDITKELLNYCRIMDIEPIVLK